ncbi:MAG: hypothetical protein NUK54_04005 [Methanothrix sp.]|nr:hypothetical protein [Methanothrix sp.]
MGLLERAVSFALRGIAGPVPFDGLDLLADTVLRTLLTVADPIPEAMGMDGSGLA